MNLSTIETFKFQVKSVYDFCSIYIINQSLDFVTYDTIGNRRTVMHLVIFIAADKCQYYDCGY